MENTGIKYPLSLDIDMRGQLWVGCDEDEGHTIMCPAVVVTTSIGSNCVVTFILECPVYVHLKPPSHPTTTTLPV
jgi:hypothetical protein